MPKYLSLAEIRESIQRLEKYHVFFGTTFLVLKQNEAPVGTTMRLSLDAENREHLRSYFHLNPESNQFFLPFQKRKNEGHWRGPKYASTSIQAINTQSFAGALLHQKDTKDWGWAPNYLEFLANKLPRDQKLSLFHFAVWFGRDEAWDDNATRADVIERFVRKFALNSLDIDKLFDTTIASTLWENDAFQLARADPDRITEDYGSPDDLPLEGSAILQFLEFTGLGPVNHLHFKPASRLNVLTGDNGLGKTFLLDIVWWALTREWAEYMIAPLEPIATTPQITFAVGKTGDQKPIVAEFSPRTFTWRVPKHSAKSGLVVYARVDGSFAVWDPANPNLDNRDESGQPRFVSFSRREVWNGDQNGRIEGLLRDWVTWQTRSDEFSIYATFEKVIQRTKPPDLGEFSIGKPQSIRGVLSSREIPTLVHPYGIVPIIYESAGIRRILSLAYLIVWAWNEHKFRSKLAGRKTERQLVILIDEAEAHLHPRWQRSLLLALLGIAKDLHDELAIQYFVASHSPLILASAEPIWEPDRDKLFHLRMDMNGRVRFDHIPFELRGTVDSWLKSPSFDNLHPGSEAAERALQQAKSLLDNPNATAAEVQAASNNLAEHVPAGDPFWLRWVLFATEHGVDL